MAKLKYDVSDVEDIAEGTHAPVGTYRAKIRTAEPKESKAGNQMIEVVYDLTHDAKGAKLKEQYNPIWYYPILDHEHPFVQARFKEFVRALGAKAKGTLDTDKMVGVVMQLKLGSDTDADGNYRPTVKKVMPAERVEEQPPEDEPAEDEPETEEEEAEEEEAEEEEEQSLEEALADLDRAGLKALIKEHGLEVKVLKSDSDDDLRAKITEAWPEDEEAEEEEEEAEEEEEEEEDGEEAPDYTSWKVADLNAELAKRELPATGSAKVKAARLAKDDEEQPF